MHTLFLASKVQDDVLFGEAAARSLGIPFRMISQAEALAQIDKGGKDPIIFGLQSPECIAWFLKETLPRLKSKQATLHPELVHVIGSLDHSSLEELTSTDSFGSFIHRSADGARTAGKVFGELIAPMVARRLGLKSEKKAAAEGSTPWTFVMRDMNEKATTLRELQETLEGHSNYRPKIVEAIVLATDELLINALTGLGGDGSLDIHVLTHEDQVRVTVVDRAGKLKRSGLISNILRDYRKSSQTIGAMKGLALTFRMGGSLVFKCEPGKATEATVYYRITKDYKSFLEQFRFVAVQGGTE